MHFFFGPRRATPHEPHDSLKDICSNLKPSSQTRKFQVNILYILEELRPLKGPKNQRMRSNAQPEVDFSKNVNVVLHNIMTIKIINNIHGRM